MNDQSFEPPIEGRRRSAPDDSSIVDLLGQLTRQSAHLAQEQVNLVQAEMRETANDLKGAVGAFAGAAVLGIAGLGVVLMGLSFLLATAIDNVPLATLIVGAAAMLVAAIMYGAGKKKANATSLKPERTIRTAGDTPAAATGHMTTAGGTYDR